MFETLQRGVVSLLNVAERAVAKEMVIGVLTPESLLPGAFSVTDPMTSWHWSKWTLQAACLNAHLLWTATASAAVVDPVA